MFKQYSKRFSLFFLSFASLSWVECLKSTIAPCGCCKRSAAMQWITTRVVSTTFIQLTAWYVCCDNWSGKKCKLGQGAFLKNLLRRTFNLTKLGSFVGYAKVGLCWPLRWSRMLISQKQAGQARVDSLKLYSGYASRFNVQQNIFSNNSNVQQRCFVNKI